MALALAKILTLTTGIDMDGFTILGVKPGEASLGAVTNWLLVFLAINHLLSWLGDYRSFRSWNRPVKVVPKGTIDTQMTKPVSNMEYLAEHLAQQVEMVDKRVGGDTKMPDAELLKAYRELTTEAINLVRETNRLTFHAGLYLWGWFLVLPLFATIYALCL